jgi:hypothetical protein
MQVEKLNELLQTLISMKLHFWPYIITLDESSFQASTDYESIWFCSGDRAPEREEDDYIAKHDAHYRLECLWIPCRRRSSNLIQIQVRLLDRASESP